MEVLMYDKYRPNLDRINSGEEIERHKVVFVPKEKDGKFQTSDGTCYQRDENGCIRKVRR